jgi:hypothetical protein
VSVGQDYPSPSSTGQVLRGRTPDAIVSAGHDYPSPRFSSPDDLSKGTSTVYHDDDDVYVVQSLYCYSSSSHSLASGRQLAWLSWDHGEDPKMPTSSDFKEFWSDESVAEVEEIQSTM